MLQSNYKYAGIIQEAESIAKEEKKGLWSNEQEITNEVNEVSENKAMKNSFIVLIIILIIGIISMLLKKVNTKRKNKKSS